jgi:hypothetical protein
VITSQFCSPGDVFELEALGTDTLGWDDQFATGDSNGDYDRGRCYADGYTNLMWWA